jgi:two-component sensor histidine kinase
MASLSDLARQHTALGAAGRAHLRRLTGSWAPLADLSFSDLLLLAPTMETSPRSAVVLGQIRPTTAQTVFVDDLVGRVIDLYDEPLVAKVLDTGDAVEGEQAVGVESRPTRVTVIPVTHEGRLVAVVVRYYRLRPDHQHRLNSEHPPSELERAYLSVFNRLATMIADGTYPFPFEGAITEESPRVGDGALILDSYSRVVYSSPNAVSALHRIGYHGRITGQRMEEMGFDGDVVASAFRLKVPVIEEVQRGELATVLARTLPLIEHGEVNGALVLVRDVSDLRRRDRMLVSMDTTIREIHHRVKNNLQTVSSLLRIQGRRLASPEAKSAIEESVRRIGAIAVVHEMLANSGGDEVVFRDVVQPIVAMAESALVSSEVPVRFRLVGEGATLTASRASSLAVVVTELLQNAVEHGYPPGSGGGVVTVELVTSPDELLVRVHDDGVGVDPDFDLDSSLGLGLTIIKSLVTGELQGELRITPATAPQRGTLAQVTVTLADTDG